MYPYMDTQAYKANVHIYANRITIIIFYFVGIILGSVFYVERTHDIWFNLIAILWAFVSFGSIPTLYRCLCCAIRENITKNASGNESDSEKYHGNTSNSNNQKSCSCLSIREERKTDKDTPSTKDKNPVVLPCPGLVLPDFLDNAFHGQKLEGRK
jgi:hypothetical protein